METKQTNNELDQWFSTYGVISAERILGTYGINLPSAELLVAIKSPFSFYHQILQVPLKNVLNGIIFQQANDYHVYVQKLFIDYLLSGESSKGEETQGAHTRELLEEERKNLVSLGEAFHQKQIAHELLISSSQAILMKIAREWKVAMESGIRQINSTFKNYKLESKKSVIRNAISHALIYCDLTTANASDNKYQFIDQINEVIKLNLTDEIKDQLVSNLSELFNLTINFNNKINSFFERAVELGEQVSLYRTQFYATILRVADLIKLLPDYKIDPVQDAANRESLYFDKTIGEHN